MRALSLLARLAALCLPLCCLANPAADAPGTPLTVCIGGPSPTDPGIDKQLDYLHSIGVTSVEVYIFWNKIEKTPGVMDWSEYDQFLALLKRHGLKWVPFFTAGPYYTTPDFVRNDPKIVMFRCLEHDRDSKIPSIWSPRLRELVGNYIRKFAEHYVPMGGIEIMNIGVSGDYGESIYSVIGNWPGDYHSHPGYWCADPLAIADFRRVLRARYPGGIADLNRAWKSSYASFDAVSPFLPAKAPSERAWQEQMSWYRDSMTDYTDFWLSTFREAMPNTDIMMCAGGDMAQEHGSDFAAQAKIAARHGIGLRVTNEASSFPMNVRQTRLVDSACRLYGTFSAHEPANTVTPVGMLGRIFNAATSGASQLHFYGGKEVCAYEGGKIIAGESAGYLTRYHDLLRKTRPVIDVALYYPRLVSTDSEHDREDFSDLAAEIRRFVDYDFADDRMIADGALDSKSILIVAQAKILQAETASKIEAWVRKGGVVFLVGERSPDWDGSKAAFDRIAGLGPDTDRHMGITQARIDVPAALPSIASLQTVTLIAGFSGLVEGCEPLLSMDYAPRIHSAWRRTLGSGRVYAYFGPMDLAQREEAWMESQRLPLSFMRDSIADCVAKGVLHRVPRSLNLGSRDAFLVDTTTGLWALNMGANAVTVGSPAIEVPGHSIVVR